MDKEYTEKHWEEEMRLNKFCGQHPNWFYSGCSLQCPQCRSVGFYGPKFSQNTTGEITRKYRACKFCGLWQEAWGEVWNIRGGEPYRCTHFYCDQCKEYGWTMTDNLVYCSKQHEMKKIDWASDDPNHYFHKLKEEMNKIHQNLSFPR